MRTPLPERRPSETIDVPFGTITVGFDMDGRPREVFADGPRSGSDMRHLLADACVIISIALQSGVPPQAMRKSLGTVPDLTGGPDQPASAIGAIMGALSDVTHDT